MWKSKAFLFSAAIQFTLALAVAALATNSFHTVSAVAKEKCISIGEKRVCFDDGKGKKEQDDNDDDDDGEGNAEDDGNKPQPTGNKCQGEIACPAGYVVLDKPK
jgi:hypothetical protein